MSDNASDNIMENGPDNGGDAVLPVVGEVKNTAGELIGYSCEQTLANNIVTDVDLVFYFDLAYPMGAEATGLQSFQNNLIEAVSAWYGISSGDRCEVPPLDGKSSWLVQFLSDAEDYSKVEIFESCRQLSYDAINEECFVYEATVTGSVLGTKKIPDVMDYIEALLEGDTLPSNPDYKVGFLGVLVENQVGEDEIKENLDSPASIKEEDTNPSPESEKNTVTIVGGLLVAAFCFAFIGIILVLYRRRKQYMKDVQLMKHGDLEHRYDTEPNMGASSEDLEHAPSSNYNHHHRNMVVDEIEEMPSNEEDFPNNNITFDLGTSFKDQLMGRHGGGPPRGHPGTLGAMVSGPYGGGTRMAMNSDASESDADSWAQTDGTIGSLELQLEPITAEV